MEGSWCSATVRVTDQLHPVHRVEYCSTSGIHVVRSEIDKDPRNVQAREHLARRSRRTCRRKRSNKKNSTGQKKSRSFTTARKRRGIYLFDPEDLVFSENHEELHEITLELHMDSEMPCKLGKPSGNSSVGAPKGPQEKLRYASAWIGSLQRPQGKTVYA